MIVTLIVLCEVGFWVLLAAGLALRYVARKPRLGAAVLLCEPLLEVVLLVVTAIDLKNGAEPDWKHGLAAVYIGFTVGLGHSTIKWVDARVAHRFAGGPPPVKPPKYGMARAAHEWRTAARWTVAAVDGHGPAPGGGLVRRRGRGHRLAADVAAEDALGDRDQPDHRRGLHRRPRSGSRRTGSGRGR